MVARLIRKSRFWSIVLFAGICVAAAFMLTQPAPPKAVAQLPGGAMPGGAAPGGPAGAARIPPGAAPGAVSRAPFVSCYNTPWGCTIRGCSTSPESSPGDTSDDGGGPETAEGMVVTGTSTIEHATFNYSHSAVDYQGAPSGTSGSACGTCQSGTAIRADSMTPKSLALLRYYRSRDVSQMGGLGPGFFHNFDIKLHLFDGGTANQWGMNGAMIDLFDPARLSQARFTPSGTLFKELSEERTVRGIRIFNASGQELNPSGGVVGGTTTGGTTTGGTTTGGTTTGGTTTGGTTTGGTTTGGYTPPTGGTMPPTGGTMPPTGGTMPPTGSGTTSSVFATAKTAKLEAFDGGVFEFEIVVMDAGYVGIEAFAPDPSRVVRSGRLTKYTNRAGYGFTVTYRTWTAAQITESPERQWQIDHVTGAAGDTLTFSYGTQQVGGRWAVSQVQLPNGETVGYTYANGSLQSVQHPGGGVSTFAHTYDPVAQTTKLSIHDVATDHGYHHKDVYLTLAYNYPGMDDFLINQASQLARLVIIGEGASREVAYMNLPAPGTQSNVIYGGQGKLILLSASRSGPKSSAHYRDGATVNLQGPFWPDVNAPASSVTGVLEPQSIGSGGIGNITMTRSASGVETTYTYDSDGWINKTTHSDGTFETTCRNDFKRVLRHRDRLGRVTRNTYDARGNRLTTEVGLTENPNGGASSPCATDDVQTADFALSTWEYYPAGHAHQHLLAATTDPLGNRTDYQYDTHHRLWKVIQPAETPNSPRAETVSTYDAVGRLSAVTDPEGHETTYFYDGRNRVTKISHADASSERFLYGTGADARLLVKQVDRRGIVTNHEYDAAGRRIRTVTPAATMDLAGGETPINDPSVTVEETWTYLDGTSQIASRTRAGETVEYSHDYRQRVVETRVKPNTGKTLISKQVYANNQLFASEDPYGRKSFHAYDASDGRLIRSAQATSPSVTFADQAAILAEVRSATNNSPLLITDYLYDAAGQTTSVIDPRGVASTTEYDSRGRSIRSLQAADTVAAGGSPAALSAKTETIYDAASRVVEVRSPRYFDASDTNGVNAAKTVMTYTGRGRLATRTEAPGTPQAATESSLYDIAGHQISKTDARGHVWQTLRPNCCGRVQLSVDPLGHGTITRTDWNGNVVHQATVADVLSHENTSDPLNAKTLQEVTTKYDLRNRPVARTVWLTPRGAVVFTDPPIAGDEGIAATEGITTRYQYDDDLTDGVGLDQQFSQHLAGLNLGTGCNGSAALVTNPEGERTLSIKDGLGRAVRSVQLDANGAAVVSSTTTHDAVVTIAGYGAVLETSSANALGHTTKQRTDGAGRVIQSLDAEGFVTTFEYDANGNRKKVRDPNGVGQDCIYDALNRDVSCSDTQELLSNLSRTKTYDLAGNTTKQTDAKGNSTYSYFDARGRRFETKDRNNATTSFTHDAAGNELSMTDAEAQTTSYEYDQLGRRTKIVWPDHVAGQNPGDANCGFTTTAYGAAGRAVLKQDQQGDTAALVYDMAGRMLAREYRTLANSTIATPNAGVGPFVTGNIADQDTFTYDAAEKMLTAVKGRYSNTVSFTYEHGRKLTESLAIFGQTYTVTSGYDAAGRENSLTYPDGTVVTRTHTAKGQLATISRDGTVIDSRVYDNGGRLTSETLGNGLVVNRTYNADNMPASITNSAVGDYAYSWDENKNKTGETVTGAMTNFSSTMAFDNQNRLTAWNRASGDSQSWQLSPVNDWQSVTTNGSTQTRTHGPTHEILTVGPAAIQHDARGNISTDDAAITRTYDADNKVSQAVVPAGSPRGIPGTHTYHYDALGRRIRKTTGGTNPTDTIFLHTGSQIIADYPAGTAPASPQSTYIWGSYIDELVCQRKTTSGNGPTDLYPHRNQQYSTTAVTDQTGHVVERYAYTSYGELTTLDPATLATRTTNPLTRYTYTSREHDPEIGSYHFRNRDYLASLGRFTSHDPILYPDGWNTYAGWFAPFQTDPSGSVTITCECRCNDSWLPGITRLGSAPIDCPSGDASACCVTACDNYVETVPTRYRSPSGESGSTCAPTGNWSIYGAGSDKCPPIPYDCSKVLCAAECAYITLRWVIYCETIPDPRAKVACKSYAALFGITCGLSCNLLCR